MRIPTLAPPPLPPGHARATEVLRELRAADASWATAKRGPSAPGAPRSLPSRDLIERLTAVATAMHADYVRHVEALAVLDGISEAIADGADPHAARMALAPIAEQLADLAPVQKAQVA